MKIVFRRQAKLDLLEARRWYEEREPGLGFALRTEVEARLNDVQEYPEIHPRVDERIRRAALGRFPYGIFYVVDGETIRVIAILHRARSPEIWKRR
ncbi:MAG TPA: type II toxin-antitoxin system RelE/ParE family toxin [Thermoanaerobaculia bacterium]|jgi:plasmid stabilization system protein ParE|nr:type II toxin-antitoxin system RelE/ParE family toxin [Thermoanaerobaculia bacterium]